MGDMGRLRRTLSMMMRCCAFGALAFVSVAYAAQCTTDVTEIPGIQARLDMCPASAPFWGFMGCMMALVFSCLGAAYGTAKSGVGVGNMGVLHASSITGDNNYAYASYSGYSALAAGSCCGLAGLAAGVAIGVVGDAGVRCNARNPKLFVGVILILIFAEALGLYGLIVALILSSNTMKCDDISQFTVYSPSCGS